MTAEQRAGRCANYPSRGDSPRGILQNIRPGGYKSNQTRVGTCKRERPQVQGTEQQNSARLHVKSLKAFPCPFTWKKSVLLNFYSIGPWRSIKHSQPINCYFVEFPRKFHPTASPENVRQKHRPRLRCPKMKRMASKSIRLIFREFSCYLGSTFYMYYVLTTGYFLSYRPCTWSPCSGDNHILLHNTTIPIILLYRFEKINAKIFFG